ncbi:class IV adenylate cyclase [Methanothermococcus okinawensis]|uniref:Adenylyl cyclase CyaB n=1 Tax=Methanothermococcus okinawensis (strain DSM 14208 / JCM 11175 / IH1) TaxID=647113 RepID=F8AJN5_METOI|nr:class IV adenylate cyclase [Methanothermococcus okinawensis]AEH07228.1 adenylyl cyclase CyaB [Methanothermococcus okinawensis IH1]
MIEVELKAKLEKDEILNFIRKLEDLGFKRIIKKEETDIYYNGIDRDFRKTDEALRIRKSVNMDGIDNMDIKYVRYYLTYKGPKMDNISKTREELEVQVSDGETTKKILEKLGFKPVKPIVKIREIYKRDDIEISIDEVKDVGNYVEFEKIVEFTSEKENAINELINLMKSLNISKDKLIKTSYLELRDKNE